MDESVVREEQIYMDDHENDWNMSDGIRFNKRLEKYRTHSNDCKLRVNQSSEQIYEQQSNEISMLKSKTKDQKKKRMRRKSDTNSLENQQLRLCQSSQQHAHTSQDLTQSSYFQQFLHYSQQQQHSHEPFIYNKPENQQKQQRPAYTPENEFEDLDFDGIAKLMNEPLGLELFKIDEELQQVASNGLHQYSQVSDFCFDSNY